MCVCIALTITVALTKPEEYMYVFVLAPGVEYHRPAGVQTGVVIPIVHKRVYMDV